VITEVGRDVIAARPSVNEIWKDGKKMGKVVEKRDEAGDNGGSCPQLAGA
jgi:hypothetical protein